MAEFKLTISDPKTGKSFQREVKDEQAKPFIGMRIGDKVVGDKFDLAGYEFELRGGSDKSGFPMRSGIKSPRQRILVYKGTGCKSAGKGIKTKKTVCGHTINTNISQINLKVIKAGKTPLGGEAAAEEKKAEVKEEKAEAKEEKPSAEEKKAEAKEVKEEPKKEAKEEKPEAKEEKPKEEKTQEKPAEEPKEAAEKKE